MYGIANLSLPLFSGFRVRYGIESAQYLEKAADLDADNDKKSVLINTVGAYANLYKAHENVFLLQQELAQSQKRDSDFADMDGTGCWHATICSRRNCRTNLFVTRLQCHAAIRDA